MQRAKLAWRSRALGVVCLCLLSCAASKELNLGDQYFSQGEFQAAYQAYARAAELAPDNAEIQEKFLRAKIFALFEGGREKIFNNDYFGALQDFQEILELDPNNETAQKWVYKTNREIAGEKIEAGFRLLSEDEFEAAIDAFEEAKLYLPDDERITAGLEKIQRVVESRLRKSEDYYLMAIRNRAAGLLYQAETNFNKSEKYQPGNRRLEEERDDVRKQLATSEFLKAWERERRGEYGAAYIGYRTVAQLDADYPNLNERMAIVDQELAAEELLRRAKQAITRNQFDLAVQALDKGLRLTSELDKQVQFEQLLQQVRDREIAHLYLTGRTLEEGQRYDPALQRYKTILTKTASYQDVVDRVQNIQQVIDHCEELYKQVHVLINNGQEAEAVVLLKEIRELYPNYKDTEQTLQSLGE